MASGVWLVIALSAGAMIAAGFSRNQVPVVVSVVIGGLLRVAFALITSKKYTPDDVAVTFRATAVAVLHGQDPLLVLPGRQWNFLELMPYVHALEFKSGLPWVEAVKIAPITADLVLIWLVSRLAGADGRTRALQYAVNPLSLLVVSLHGQVEPVALAFALGGILLLKKNRHVLAGVLLGAAVAAITWPVLVLIAVLPLRQPKRITQILAGSAIVPVACLASGVIFLHTNIPQAIGKITTYSGPVSGWTWSGTWMLLGHRVAGYSSPLRGLSWVLIILGVSTALWLLRRHPPEVRALGTLAAVLACTAGFGVQYLLWVLPLAFAVGSRWRNHYTAAAGFWALLFYAGPPGTAAAEYRSGLSWLPAGLLVAIIVELVRRPPYRTVTAPADPGEQDLTDALPPSVEASHSRGRHAVSQADQDSPVPADRTR